MSFPASTRISRTHAAIDTDHPMQARTGIRVGVVPDCSLNRVVRENAVPQKIGQILVADDFAFGDLLHCLIDQIVVLGVSC